MGYDARESAGLRNCILAVSAVAWIVLLAAPGGIMRHSPASDSAMPASFRMQLVMSPPASLAAGWVLMLAAMMLPVLIPPLLHVRRQSFTHRRASAIALFLAGYAGIWMAIGGVLLTIELTAASFAPQSLVPAAASFLAAAVWQCSPIKQRCLNHCHAHTELAAFGLAADRAALCFGISHGTWCAGSCWALMLCAMLLPHAHTAAMAAAAVLIFCERLEPPMPPGWRWRGLGRVLRLLTAQRSYWSGVRQSQ